MLQGAKVLRFEDEDFESDLARIGARVGDAVIIGGRKFLVLGRCKTGDLVVDGMSPILFRCLDGTGGYAFFHRSHLITEALKLSPAAINKYVQDADDIVRRQRENDIRTLEAVKSGNFQSTFMVD